jgi:hypothetical protein|tara:strand:+ start:119 stop:283 length:165 start_codon:yes stop_codon:yes gene_type:complete
MKNLFTLMAFVMLISFNSCTENIITEDEQLIFEIQTIDKDDVDPRENEDPEDPT